jgi:glucuronoxylan 4-O-methyltransferase
MKSIAQSAKLANIFGDIFVHDCDREIEKIYCDRFLKEANLVESVEKMKHYHIANRIT